jgi:ketosteroid isomerase-like protein
MSAAERDAFLDAMVPAQIRAGIAIHNGDLDPWLSIWSSRDPVTVTGAAVPLAKGWRDVRSTFDWVGGLYETCDDFDFELVVADASGDLAYTVGIERYTASTTAGTIAENTLRVTHVYRREPEGWRIVHRHGDHMPTSDPRAALS